MKRAAVAALAVLLMGGAWCSASEPPPLKTSYHKSALKKLGRGAANMVTAPLELIRTPSLVNERDGWIAGLTVGLTQGVAATAVREVAGIIEVATFFLPIPNHFRPLITPEFVLRHGVWEPDVPAEF